jgi:Icc protein
MERREFVKRVGLGLAAGWAATRLFWPWRSSAAGPEIRVALLADTHLKDGNDRRPEARSLARAVTEIRQLSPPPDLVLLAGDLAHRGRPDALDLGREILADLPAPVWAVRGEGDCHPGRESAWARRWGDRWFSRPFRGFHLLGLDTALHPGPGGPIFEIGASQRRWLARELALLSPSTPLIVLSHAPLARLFQPWQQWTGDAPAVAALLARFPQVLCLHGHVHGACGFPAKFPGSSQQSPPPLVGGARGEGEFFTPTLTLPHQGGGSGNGWQDLDSEPAYHGITHYGLPATAWPRPQAIQGTPAVVRPGQGPHGCGWALATLGGDASRRLQPCLWQA